MYTEILNPRLSCQKSIQQEADSFHQQIGLKFKEETSKFLRFELNWGVLKCGAGAGWRRPAGPIV